MRPDAATLRLAVFPRRGGRAPELEDGDTLEWLGRFLGRIHAVGRARPFAHRPAIDIASFGEEPRDFLLASGFIPPELLEPWKQAAALALEAVRHCFARAGKFDVLRLHEPARFVGADGQDGEAEAAVLFRRRTVVATAMEAGVADMIDPSRTRFDNEARPERHATVAHASRRPVMHGLEMDRPSLPDIEPLAQSPTRRRDPPISRFRIVSLPSGVATRGSKARISFPSVARSIWS